MINEKVLQYKQRYTDKDVQDFLAMAALQFVIKVIDSDNRLDDSYIMEELKELNAELDEYIKRE
jgi:cell division protein ZapA